VNLPLVADVMADWRRTSCSNPTAGHSTEFLSSVLPDSCHWEDSEDLKSKRSTHGTIARAVEALARDERETSWDDGLDDTAGANSWWSRP